jgi:hypothetical protein
MVRLMRGREWWWQVSVQVVGTLIAAAVIYGLSLAAGIIRANAKSILFALIELVVVGGVGRLVDDRYKITARLVRQARAFHARLVRPFRTHRPP